MKKMYVDFQGEEVATIIGISRADCMELADEQNLTEEFGYQWRWEAAA